MVTKTSCPNCQRMYDVDDSMVGKTANCGACKTSFPVRPLGVSGPASPAGIPILIGQRYQVRSELGRGAFGVALKAFDQKLEREVAVKMLLPEALNSPDAIQRFLLEAKVLAELGHPNIVPIFDKGQHDTSYYLVCKLVKGKTLYDLMPKGGFPDPRVAIGYIVTLCRTLHSVYTEHKILHRDIKPANMMLEKDHLYLMDFGMAACYDKNPLNSNPGDEEGLATVAGSAVGTPAYMPPEQAFFNREQIGPWSDIYSAGAVLYHFLTGSIPIPWKGNILDILQARPLAPSYRRADLDPALDAIILKSLEKKPADRYRNGQDFAAALQRWLDGPRSFVPLPNSRPAVALPKPVPAPTVAPPIIRPTPAIPEPVSRESKRNQLTIPSTRQSLPPIEPEPVTEEPEPAKNRTLLYLGGGAALLFGALLVIGIALAVIFSGKADTKPTPTKTGQSWLKE